MILMQHGISSMPVGTPYEQGWTEDENVTTSLGHRIPVEECGIDISLQSIDKLTDMQLANDSCGIDVSLIDIEHLSGTAIIGSRTYKTQQIGNQIWLAENLDYKYSGLTVGQSGYSTSVPMANYYNDDETTYGESGNKYGLLYNWAAVKYLNDNRATLCPGWHIPTLVELNELISAIGGSATGGTKLKSATGWTSGNGSDVYGFCAYPTGCNNSASGFINVGANAYFWTQSETSSINDTADYLLLSTDALARIPEQYKDNEFSIRLIHD